MERCCKLSEDGKLGRNCQLVRRSQMVHTSCYGRIWKGLEMVGYSKNGNILLYGTYFYFWESLGNCKIFGNFKMGLTRGVVFGKIEKNKTICDRCQVEARFLECQKMERFGANTQPAKNFQVKILQGIFWKGVPESCLFFVFLEKNGRFTENGRIYRKLQIWYA